MILQELVAEALRILVLEEVDCCKFRVVAVMEMVVANYRHVLGVGVTEMGVEGIDLVGVEEEENIQHMGEVEVVEAQHMGEVMVAVESGREVEENRQVAGEVVVIGMDKWVEAVNVAEVVESSGVEVGNGAVEVGNCSGKERVGVERTTEVAGNLVVVVEGARA